jgi:hypothetical protein
MIVIFFVSSAVYVLFTRCMFFMICCILFSVLYVFLFCVFSVFVVLYIVSQHVYSCFFSIFVRVHAPLPPVGKQILVNEYHIMYRTCSDRTFSYETCYSPMTKKKKSTVLR